jgi:hypothetical protein
METQEFEKKLEEMKKPDITPLKHEELLSRAIINAADKSVVSWWWLSVPLFILTMLVMKSLYMPGTTLISNLHETKAADKIMTVIFFLIAPVMLIIFNILDIRKIHYLSGSPKSFSFAGRVVPNILIITLALLILLIYVL